MSMVLFILLAMMFTGSFMDTNTGRLLPLDIILKPDPPMHFGFVLPHDQRQDVMGGRLFYEQITQSLFTDNDSLF